MGYSLGARNNNFYWTALCQTYVQENESFTQCESGNCLFQPDYPNFFRNGGVNTIDNKMKTEFEEYIPSVLMKSHSLNKTYSQKPLLERIATCR
ncbi:hypothetical protein NUKP32_53640 [Klebsiella variicola]|nr:hypothetical protein NUKP32_53640 [Klebsiella variicola]